MSETTAQESVDALSRKQQKESQLYAGRVKVHPMSIWGTFRKLKWAAVGILLAIYYLVPWIRWDRGPGAPDQAVLIDMPSRRAYFFFIEIWPQEVYYLAGLLILGAIGLFWVTSLLGRVWCGFACPQTVWTDLYMQVERWIEGDRNARIKLDKQPMNREKLVKRVSKHAVWLVIAVLTGGAWVMYFKDAPTLAREFFVGESSASVYGFTALFTATTYLLAGWAREQVCTYMCPWPRFQAAMFDEDSMIVTYEGWRGEPRGKPRKNLAHISPKEMPPGPDSVPRQGLANIDWGKAGEQYDTAKLDGLGDCVACNKCVAVCPTGIDIRDGVQLECIGCGLCIDACNSVMEKLGRPRNLITYDTLSNQDRYARGEPGRFRLVRPRTVLYTLLFLVVAGIMLWSLAFRATADINVLHDRNPLFVTLSDGSIRNGYTIKILNKTRAERDFTLDVRGIEGATMSVVGQGEGGGDVTLAAQPDSVATYKVYVTAPREAVRGAQADVSFALTDMQGETALHETVFRGPER
ncbi:4Fe-4S dicluster domain-containing protein [Ferruginivarius sediminum]|uniref:4Fe-4S binding protein n=1 Tax=Ferruginivarius sediminum TaxID=2661937 RepID=A0A369T7B7_9PROT|nr:4Fe-4S dicluster domain-containing protein [Ferruginivarius sediminum]RDD61168.1 4Fe-4S binding protein [Ferruginivarius sediminum]